MRPLVLILDHADDPPRLMKETMASLDALKVQYRIAIADSRAQAFNEALITFREEIDGGCDYVVPIHPGVTFSKHYFEMVSDAFSKLPSNIGFVYTPYYNLGETREPLPEHPATAYPFVRPAHVTEQFNWLWCRFNILEAGYPAIRREAIEPMVLPWYDWTGEDKLLSTHELNGYIHQIAEKWLGFRLMCDPADTYQVRRIPVEDGGVYFNDGASALCRARIVESLLDYTPTTVEPLDNPPLVSVVITSYNHEDFIIKAIESVLNQDYPKLELIVVDDCSTDNSWERINEVTSRREYAGPKLPDSLPPIRATKLLKRSENGGFREALKMGFDEAEGEFFLCVGSDDFLTGYDHISKMVATLLNNADAVGTIPAIAHTAPDGTWADQPFTNDGNDRLGIFRPPAISPMVYVVHNYGILGGSLFRTQAISDAGGIYETEIHNNLTDYNLFLRLLKVGKVVSTKDALYGYRTHPANNRLLRDETVHNKALMDLRTRALAEFGYREGG